MGSPDNGYRVNTMTFCGKTTPPVYDRIRQGIAKTLHNAKRACYEGMTFQWFVNGSFQATGVKDSKDVDILFQTHPLFLGIKVESIRMVMCSLSTQILPVNLLATYHQLQKNPDVTVSYDWERFKGLVVKDVHRMYTVLIYRSGNVTLFGKESCKNTITYFHTLLLAGVKK